MRTSKQTLALTLQLSIMLIANPVVAKESSESTSVNPASTNPKSTTAESSPAPKSNSAPLKGGVVHAEVLPALIDDLRPGKVYSDDLLLKSGTKGNNLWYHIPSWYAGVRHADSVTIVYRYFYATGETTQPNQKQLERQDSLAGFQKDRTGGIWDFKRSPSIQHVESDLVNAVLFVRSITPLQETQDQFQVKYEEISISLDKRSNKILEVTQQEQINTITSPEPGLLRIDVSVKSFDQDGQPVRKEQSVAFAKITKPFERIDQCKGEDLRPLFKDFLISQHLEDILPDDLK